MGILAHVMGYTLTAIIGILGLTVVWLIIVGKIDLSKLISEDNGNASMSRFQFLIFTFVIAMSLFVVVAVNKQFPDNFPNGIFILLGMSGGSYVISKGIQKAAVNNQNKPTDPTPVKKT